MQYSQIARNKLFWGLDWIKKSIIRKQVREIGEAVGNYPASHSGVERDRLLRELLSHAAKTTRFYRSLKDNSSIAGFPVINKNLIREDYEAFRSELYPEEKCIPVYTSGSTGSPLVIMQNKEKKIRNTADTIYFASIADFQVGQRLYYFRLWDGFCKKSRLLATLQNMEMVNVMHLSDDYLAKLIHTWQTDHSKKGIMGYVSGFTQLCKYLDKIESPPLKCNISSTIAVAETLNSYCKYSMEKYFQAPVISRYSNSENGILAQQAIGGNADFIANWGSYLFEIFDLDSDVPVENGTLGRIVITDLFNHAMPLIRYDTGDVGFMDINEHGVPVLKNIQGRKMDMLFDTKGRILNPSLVWNLDSYSDIKQFQLIQNAEKSYTIRLNVDEKFDSAGKIIEEFTGYFGEDAEVRIEQTNEIPVLASGKRRLVVNNFQKTNQLVS
jgi:phenylacetate-CoA ligase